jgi:hypothetical protein
VKKKIIFGSILALVLLIFTSFPSVVGTQSNDSLNNIKTNILNKKINYSSSNEWYPGFFIIFILGIFVNIFGQILINLIGGFYP